jgi:hypothetical protein
MHVWKKEMINTKIRRGYHLEAGMTVGKESSYR